MFNFSPIVTIDIEDNHNPKRPNCGKRCKTLKDCPKGQYCMENRGPCGYTCTLPDTEAGIHIISSGNKGHDLIKKDRDDNNSILE